ncbi:ribosome small subunit-dependent GTPase A [Seleniivibrio sp.]|uniref:ribosome small subunit-dependent GTPase A n=1 Tax=Seleniivibrio sp. TaxID=2898801 RepID=UPI0025D18245|nr:ribosome small subunit-dependent GTPase A [Seleniivibrio sp.]MCD8553657.1 ribosome small subunit-dependent GTPase A [Seleniivibrio sp.]
MNDRFRVIFASREIYELKGGYRAVLSGKLRNTAESLPVVGDMVVCSDGYVIESIEPRKTELKRSSPSGGAGMQVLAANATHLLIVMAMGAGFSIRRLERFLVLAASAGIQPVVALTKCDLVNPVDAAVAESEVKEAADIPVFCTSTVTGEGIGELSAYFSEGDIICLAGLSGAGKSSLLNAFCNTDFETSAVRESDGKGKHTTTARHFIETGKGYSFIDTPGIREVGIGGDAGAVEEVFDDIAKYAKMCRFSDCTHTGEPDCAVLAAVASGALSAERLAGMHKLKKESAAKNESERKVRDKKLSKTVKQIKKLGGTRH